MTADQKEQPLVPRISYGPIHELLLQSENAEDLVSYGLVRAIVFPFNRTAHDQSTWGRRVDFRHGTRVFSTGVFPVDANSPTAYDVLLQALQHENGYLTRFQGDTEMLFRKWVSEEVTFTGDLYVRVPKHDFIPVESP